MLDPLDTLPEWSGRWKTLGWQLAEWSVGRFVVPDGKQAGNWMELSDRQLNFLLNWYAVDDAGEFIFQGSAMRQPRGTGKSPLMAFLACCELVGPVRFGGWDSSGEPIGIRATMPLVNIAAVSLDQTENVMNYCREWLGKGSPLQEEFNLDPGKQIIYLPRSGAEAGGSLRVITSSAATARGARPSAVFADETGEWTDSNGGTRFRARLGENAGKVWGSRVVEGANAWTPGSGCVAENRWRAYQSEIESGIESRFLMDVREAPADTDWSDPDSIREALQIVYKPVPWQDPEQFMPQIVDRYKPINESMREFGNLRVSALSSWVSAQDWDACEDELERLDDGDEIVMFCDPSETDDATALVACRVSDGLVQPLWIHEPKSLDENGQPHGEVTPSALDRQVIRAFERYKVLAFFADVHPMEQLVKTTWRDRYGDQLHVWATKQEPIAWDMRKFKMEFAQAAELTEAEIEDKQFRHTGDLVLSRHVYHAQRREYGAHISVGKGEHSNKIDAAVAMIGARMARRMLLSSPKRRRSGKVW